MPHSAFTRGDCLLWKERRLVPMLIIQQIMQRGNVLQRASNDKYPFVFGARKNSSEYIIIHRAFASGNFCVAKIQPLPTFSEEFAEVMTAQIYQVIQTVNLTPKEALLLQRYCGIRQYGPDHHIALPMTVALIFTLLIPATDQLALKQQDSYLSMVATVPVVMILYPLLTRLWQKIPILRSPVNFNYRQLWFYSIQLSMLLGMAQGVFPLIKTGIVSAIRSYTDNHYVQSTLVGAAQGGTFATLDLIGNLLVGTVTVSRPERATLERMISPFLTNLFTFGLLRVLQTIFAKYLFSESEVERYQPAATVSNSLLMIFVLTVLSKVFKLIIDYGLHCLLADSRLSAHRERYMETEQEEGASRSSTPELDTQAIFEYPQQPHNPHQGGYGTFDPRNTSASFRSGNRIPHNNRLGLPTTSAPALAVPPPIAGFLLPPTAPPPTTAGSVPPQTQPVKLWQDSPPTAPSPISRRSSSSGGGAPGSQGLNEGYIEVEDN